MANQEAVNFLPHVNESEDEQVNRFEKQTKSHVTFNILWSFV